MKSFFIKITVVLVPLALFIFFINFRPSFFSPSPTSRKTLNVCSEAGFIPFEQISDQGIWSGFDIDLLKEFTKDQKSDLNMINISLDGIIPTLLTKKCDLIASALTVTDERAKMIQFSAPVMQVRTWAVALNTNLSAKTIKIFDSLENSSMILGCQSGSSSCLYLKDHFKNVKILQYKSENDEIVALRQRKIDFLIEDEIFVREFQKKLVLSLYIIPSNKVSEIAFGFRKDDLNLKIKINNFIAGIKDDGTYSKIKSKYF